MMAIFSDFIEDTLEVFMDDFSVYGATYDHLLNNSSEVLQRCEDVNLVLIWEKCHFMVQEGLVLDHIISNKGIEVDKAKVEVIEKLRPPTSVRGARSFLRHVSFYQWFIKDFMKIAKPLTQLLVKDVPFKFNEKCLSAFHKLKEALITTLVMQALDWELPFEVMCDASDYTVGVVLGQRKDDKPYAIYYVSCTLDGAQVSYATTEKESLVVVFALKKLRSYLINSKIIVFTNHAALKDLMKKSDSKYRLIR